MEKPRKSGQKLSKKQKTLKADRPFALYFWGSILFIVILLFLFYVFGKHHVVKAPLSKRPFANQYTLLKLKGAKISSASPQAFLKKKASVLNLLVKKAPHYSGYCINVPVLMYHHIQPETQAVSLKQTSLSVDNGMFAQQMAYLVSHGYTAISAESLAQALLSSSSLPAKSVVITIDDGYSDLYIYAYPVLQQYHLVANLMLATGLVDNSDFLTWSQIQQMHQSGLLYVWDHTWSHYPLAQGPASKDQYEIETAKNQIETETGENVDILAYPYGSFNTMAVDLLMQDHFIAAYSSIPGTYQCSSFIMSLHRTRIGNAPLSEYGF